MRAKVISLILLIGILGVSCKKESKEKQEITPIESYVDGNKIIFQNAQYYTFGKNIVIDFSISPFLQSGKYWVPDPNKDLARLNLSNLKYIKDGEYKLGKNPYDPNTKSNSFSMVVNGSTYKATEGYISIFRNGESYSISTKFLQVQKDDNKDKTFSADFSYTGLLKNVSTE
ncbi:MAG: hypothetical protein ACEPOW_10695 [Bacteroidales bacterium]